MKKKKEKATMEMMFKRYVAVQYSGMYNMFTQGYQVMELIEIDDVMDYFYIMENYAKLKEQYPNAWEDGKRIGDDMREKIYG